MDNGLNGIENSGWLSYFKPSPNQLLVFCTPALIRMDA